MTRILIVGGHAHLEAAIERELAKSGTNAVGAVVIVEEPEPIEFRIREYVPVPKLRLKEHKRGFSPKMQRKGWKP